MCCEGKEAGALLDCGCGCRGTAGLAHLACLVSAARHNVDSWTTCPTCEQFYTGAADVGLARARWALVRDRAAEDEERLFVANNLAVALKESAGGASRPAAAHRSRESAVHCRVLVCV